jgi:hypothetical protein
MYGARRLACGGPGIAGGQQLGALARHLQVDDAACELRLERPRAAAALRGPAGHRVDATRRLATRPLRRVLVHLARHARARLEQGRDRHLPGGAGRRVEDGDLPHRGGVERPEHSRVRRAQGREEREVPARDDHQRGHGTEPLREAVERGRVAAGAVGIVHDHERGPGARTAGGDGGEGGGDPPRRVQSRRVPHRGALAMGLGRELGRQAGLARARRPGQHDQLAAALACAPPVRPQPCELAVAAGERRGTRGVELARHLGIGLRFQLERGVLAQDRLVQAPEVRPRLHAHLVHERVACVAIGLQRSRLPAAAVQREHPLRVQALAQRLLLDERADPRRDFVMSPGGQVGVDRQLRRLHAQVLEPPDRVRSEGLVGHVRQRRPAPEREGVAGGGGGRAVAVPPAGDRQQALEPADVHRVRIHAQLVAAPTREDLRPPCSARGAPSAVRSRHT